MEKLQVNKEADKIIRTRRKNLKTVLTKEQILGGRGDALNRVVMAMGAFPSGSFDELRKITMLDGDC